MKHKFIFCCLSILIITSCKQTTNSTHQSKTSACNYAKGLKIDFNDGYYKVELSQIFDNQTDNFVYILHKKDFILHDSLKKYTSIKIPIQRFIATSSTHIPPLEMLGVEETLVGFSNLNYISSTKTRSRINQNLIKDIGQNQALNIEEIIMLKPDLLMGFGVNELSKDMVFLEEKNIPVVFNGEWRETHPLGKAEWIKLFGLLYDQYEKSNEIFKSIEKQYIAFKNEAKLFSYSPTVMSGSIYENVWYAPKGDSWGAQMIADAGANYLWNNEKGQGSIGLSFEDVLIKAKDADFWIGCSFESYSDMLSSQSNYKHFKAFNDKKVFSYTMKKGETGAVIYFEKAVYEPHLILEDLIHIFHYKYYDFKQLNYLTPLNE